MTLEEKWNLDRKFYGIPDTKDSRMAYYAGARAILSEMIDSIQGMTIVDELEADMLRVNDDIHSFVKKHASP